MNWVLWVLLGAAAGALYGILRCGYQRCVLIDLILGAAGAALGCLASQALGLGGANGFNLFSLLLSLLGAFLLAAVYHWVRRIF